MIAMDLWLINVIHHVIASIQVGGQKPELYEYLRIGNSVNNGHTHTQFQ